MLRKTGKILLWFLTAIILLTAGFFVAVRYPAFQTFLAHRAAEILSKSLDTKVSIDRVEISFFNKADFINFYLEDHNSDTLICAKELKIQFKVFELLNKKVNVSSILLDGGMLYLHGDSTGTKLNLTEVFKSKQAQAKSAQGKPQKFGWDIDLREFDLHNASFRYLDEKAGSDLNVKVASSTLVVNDFDIEKKQIAVQTLQIDGGNISMTQLPRKADTTHVMQKQAFHILPDDMKLSFDEIKVTNSGFKFNNYSDSTIAAKGIDFNHLDLSKINFYALNAAAIGDSIAADIKSMSLAEKRGFVLNNLTADARFSLTGLTLNKLTIKTPGSQISNYLSFRYNSPDDFSNFFSAVRIKAKLDHSVVSLKELNYFLKTLTPVEHNSFVISGELDGRINNLKGRNIEIQTARNTVFEGDFYSRGLPDIDTTTINVKVERLATTAEDIKRIYPAVVLPDNLTTLGLVSYTGTFDGLITHFVSKGKFVTAIGTATTDADFKYDKDNNKASYDGSLALNDFDMGMYLKLENILGKVSLDTKIKGGGLTIESLNAQLDGNISNITIKGYTYRDLKVNGSVLKQSFAGLLEVRDKYLDMDFNGKADLTKKIPAFNFSALVRKADLKNLNLVKQSVQVSGAMSSDFSGNSLDDMQGSVKLNDVDISRDSITAHVKYLDVEANLLSNEKKEITLNSDFAEAEMSGNFTLTDLPKALINFAKHTFIKDYTDTSSIKTPQDFALDFRVYEPGNLTQILYPKLSQINSSRLTADFNSANHTLNLQASVPEAGINDFDVRNLTVNAHITNGKFDFSTLVGRINKGDAELLDSVMLAAKRDDKDIRFDLKGSDESKNNYANLTAFITPLESQTLVRLEPGDIRLAGNDWHFDSGDSIFIQGKKITTRNLVFRSDSQAVYIDCYLKNDTSTSFKLVLDNTNLNNFSKTLITKTKEIDGIINGKLIVEDVFSAMQVYGDVVIKQFKLGDELIGDINLDSRLDSSGNNINVFAYVKDADNDIVARGSIALNADHPDVNIDIDGKRIGLNFLNYKFFDRYVKNVSGYATATATLYGTLKEPLLKGKVNLIDDTATVSFLNTTYMLHNQSVLLDEHGFNLDGIVVNDMRGKQAYGSGRINHENFKDFTLDVKVATQNPGKPDNKNAVQFLNTTAKESPGFYGKAYGTGYVTFTGSINAPDINAYATTATGTSCKLPVNSGFENNRYSFYKFVGHGKDSVLNHRQYRPHLYGTNFTLNLTATRDAHIDIILDPIAGDMISGNGSGDLKIEIDKTGETSIYGSYEIETGKYLFTLLNIGSKEFTLDKGGAVNFNGQANRAKLDVNAIYETRTSLTDLISYLINGGSTTTTSNSDNQLLLAAQTRTPVDLLLHLTGVLEQPEVHFDIKVLEPDPTIKSYVDQELALLKANETELNKQVFGLLVMGQFIPSTTSTAGAIANTSYAQSTAINTVSEFVSSQFSNYLGNLLEYANIKNLDVNLGYKQSSQLNTQSPINATANPAAAYGINNEVQLALQQRLLNNKLTIIANGNLDMNDYGTGQSASSPKTIPTGDFKVQYSLTPDGGWKADAFNRTDYDYFNARNNNKTGIGISFHQEFDKPSDLFKKKAKAKEEKKKKKAQKKADTEAAPLPEQKAE